MTFLVVPVFAFLNAGVPLSGAVAGPLPEAVALGLILGKPVGILGVSFLMTRLRLAQLPSGVTLAQMIGLSLLCGIGFTMSLFIGGLAFRDGAHVDAVRIGILCGSIVSAIAGFIVLNAVLKRPDAQKAT
ncbi:Na+/H+ antiporter NhaA [Hankyongella ginsenosidimutans]|uniref:Na+/H+ antiporter NhaA n=1 Tax=Hankyongella ginsenosidimutans TaxID=1763828 RepID=UPI0024825CF2|nr:Na+/H+ antiporter NhaA [Hankyongella ginsenosidimutans]